MGTDRMNRILGIGIAGLAVAAAVAIVGVGTGLFSGSAGSDQDRVRRVMPETVDIEQGAALFAQSCSVCHGTELQGQPNWRSPGADGLLPAPPHDESGHTWHHPDRVLFDYTQLGGSAALAQQGLEFESGMPAFGDVLSDAEIWNILAFIQSTWPERTREIQASRTEADEAQGDL